MRWRRPHMLEKPGTKDRMSGVRANVMGSGRERGSPTAERGLDQQAADLEVPKGAVSH